MYGTYSLDVTGCDSPWKEYIYRRAIPTPVKLVQRPVSDLRAEDAQDGNWKLRIEGWFLTVLSPPGFQYHEFIDYSIVEKALDLRPDHDIHMQYDIYLQPNGYTMADEKRQVAELQIKYAHYDNLRDSEIQDQLRKYVASILGRHQL